MPLKELAVVSPGIGQRIRVALFENQRRNREPSTQLALAEAASLSRQTLSNVLSSDRVTAGAAGLIARALGLSVDQLAPELPMANGGPPLAVREGTARYHLSGQKVRVFLAELRADLTKSGANDDEIEAAIRLITAPEVFTYYSGGKPREFTEDETLEGMEAIAAGVIRPRLKKKRR